MHDSLPLARQAFTGGLHSGPYALSTGDRSVEWLETIAPRTDILSAAAPLAAGSERRATERRDGFRSLNGCSDLGYAGLYQQRDGRLVAVYCWCTPELPRTHVEATVFQAPPG
jgi:hypothetical protein